MKLLYYADTDSLYIDLAERPSADSREVTPGVVLDFDAAGASGRHRHRSGQPAPGPREPANGERSGGGGR